MDVSVRSSTQNLLGQEHQFPFVLAPVAALELFRKSAEPAVGQAASAEDIAMVCSSQATHPMEEVAAVMGEGKRWFQLYWTKSDEFNKNALSRAEACGCSALVITV